MQNPTDRRAQIRLQKLRERRRLTRLQARPERLEARRAELGLRARRTAQRPADRDSVPTFYASEARLTTLKQATPRMDVRFPRVFSFIENPEPTISTLEHLARCSCDNRISEIGIHHSRCEIIDHCAEAVATVLADEAYHKHRKNLRGRFPDNPELKRMVYAVGMPSVLGITQPTEEFIVYQVRRGKRQFSDHTTSCESATTDLVNYIDKCLGTLGFRLAPPARARYSNLVSEVITNAEVHSTRPDWWVAAYYRTEESQGWGDCHITVFCFGESLAESLQRLDSRALLRRTIEQRVAHHRKLGFSKKWQEDDLWTLFAIQRGVSRQNEEVDEVGDRGQGTADLIAAFHDLAGSRVPAKMCVVSGNTHILFDGRHRIKRNAAGQDRIAFNEANSLAAPPDPNYVRHLKRKFPGTLVSLRFALDQQHLHALSS